MTTSDKRIKKIKKHSEKQNINDLKKSMNENKKILKENNMSIITQEIIETRKNFAPELFQTIEQSEQIEKYARNIVASVEPLVKNRDIEIIDNDNKITQCAKDLDIRCKNIQEIRELAEPKYKRFSRGDIGIAVCGLMKAGKSTFLSNLLETIDLPTAKEKSTAVSCEIYYNSDEAYADIEYYNEEEFLTVVVNPHLKTINKDPIDNFSDLSNINFSLEKYENGSLKRLAASELENIQKNYRNIRNFLNTGKRKIELKDLATYIAYPTDRQSNEGIEQFCRVMSSKKCTIFSKYPGGSENVVIIDTPGVDDPNEKVVENTILSLQEDADVLVLMVKPDEKPVLGKDFYNFWNALSNLKDAVNFIDRLVIVLNWNQKSDPEKKSILSFKKQMMEQGVPEHIFTDAIDCSDKNESKKVMQFINNHLEKNLHKQDEKNINDIRKSFMFEKEQIQNIVFDFKSFVNNQKDSADIAIIEYNKWFDKFIKNIRFELFKTINDFNQSSPFKEQIEEIDNIITQYREKLKNLYAKSNLELERKNIEKGDGPKGGIAITSYMDDFYMLNEEMIEKIASLTQIFAPVIQKLFVGILEAADLETLLLGENSSQKLKYLKSLFNGKNILSETIDKLLNLNEQMAYILKYRLRPALNIANKNKWYRQKGAKYIFAIDKYIEHSKDTELQNNLNKFGFENINNLKDIPLSHDIINNIGNITHSAIKHLAKKEFSEISEIANDTTTYFQMKLVKDDTEKELRNLLLPYRNQLLANNPKVKNITRVIQIQNQLNNLSDKILDNFKIA